jgi:hypothetical protein
VVPPIRDARFVDFGFGAPVPCGNIRGHEIENRYAAASSPFIDRTSELAAHWGGRPVLHSRCSRLVLKTFTDHTLRAH